QEEAVRFGHTWIGTGHFMLGLNSEGESVAARALDSLGVELGAARAAVEKVIPRGSGAMPSEIALTPRVHELLARAELLCGERKRNDLTPDLLLLALVSDHDGVGTQVLTELGATPEKIREAVDRLSPPKA